MHFPNLKSQSIKQSTYRENTSVTIDRLSGISVAENAIWYDSRYTASFCEDYYRREL